MMVKLELRLIGLCLLLCGCSPAAALPQLEPSAAYATLPPAPTHAEKTPTGLNLPAAATPSPTPTSTLAPPGHTPTADQTQPARLQQVEAEKRLASDIDSLIQQAGGEWHIRVENLNTHQMVYQRQANDKIHIASIVKVPIAMLVLARLAQRGVTDLELAQYLQERGYGGRTYAQLLQAMLVKSEEAATEVLLDYLYQPGFTPDTDLRAWGFVHTNLKTRLSTAQEVGEMLAALLQSEAISPEARRILLAYLAEYTPNDDLRLGVIRPFLPAEAEFYNKRASLVKERLIVGDAGIIRFSCGAEQSTYTIVLLGYPGATPITYEVLEKTLEDVTRLLGQYVACK